VRQKFKFKLKSFTSLLLGVLIVVLISVNALLIWVATGPRSLNDLSPYIEKALGNNGEYAVKIGQTWLVWDGWMRPVDIRLRQVSITSKSGEEFSTFPEISLGIDPLSILHGEILPTSLRVKRPVISLLQNPDLSISFGLKGGNEDQEKPKEAEAKPDTIAEGKVIPFGAVLMPLLAPEQNNNFRKLRYISIRNADITVGSIEQGVFFNATEANLIFRRDHDGIIKAELTGEILYSQYHTPVSAELTFNKNDVKAIINFDQLMPGTLSELFSDNPHMKLFNVPLSGNATLNMDKQGHLNRLGFSINGGKGTITSIYLDSVLDITKLHAEGELTNNLKNIQLDSFSASTGESEIIASAVIGLTDSMDASIKANASITNVQAANLHALWPTNLAPETRTWVTTNITAGHVPEAKVAINIAAGDLAKPILPKEAIDANIQLSDAEITYLPEHPQVKKIDALVHVDGIALDATIASAEFMGETKLSEGRVFIADLNATNPYIEVAITAQSSSADIVRFLGLPRLKKAESLNLIASQAKGDIKGKANVGFHFYSPLDENGKPGDPDITYDVNAEITDASQDKFMNKFDLQGIKGSIVVNNSLLEFKGGGTVNGASVSESQVKYLFKPEDGSPYDTFIDVNATSPVEALPKFGYPAFDWLSGKLAIKGSMKQGGNLEETSASIDLTNAAVEMKTLPYSKPAGESAKLDLTTQKKDGGVTIPSFVLQGFNADVRGNAKIAPDMSGIQSVRTTKLRLGETNLDSLYYEVIPGGFKLDAKGLVADVTHWMEDKPGVKVEPTFSFQHFPALSLKAEIERVITRKDQRLNDVKAEIECTLALCKFANVSGTTDDGKPFSMRILRNPKATRQLSINADSAGAFLRAMNILDGMEGGALTVTGNYDDTTADSVLTGKAMITKHTVKGVPVLAKLLSLASLTGIINALQGNGINFDKLHAPYTLTKDVITLKNAKSYGSSMGLTAEGTITFPARTMNIEGTVVPSYTLNNVFGRVPFFGRILTGGEGQGIFAARYSIKGTNAEPDVMVNPLSFLTPGFLRGLFDILDTGDENAAAATTVEKPAAQTDKPKYPNRP
jgi:hypothetical protein